MQNGEYDDMQKVKLWQQNSIVVTIYANFEVFLPVLKLHT